MFSLDLKELLLKLQSSQLDSDLISIPMRNEIYPSDIIYTFRAYGMPTKWSFGKAFNKMKL